MEKIAKGDRNTDKKRAREAKVVTKGALAHLRFELPARERPLEATGGWLFNLWPLTSMFTQREMPPPHFIQLIK